MLMTSIQCPECKRIFLLSFYSRACVCGWTPDQDKLKGLEKTVGKNKNKRKKNRKAKQMGNVPVKTVVNSTVGGRNDSWEVEIDKVHNCDKVPTKQKVLIDLFVKRKINALMKKYPNIEWLAYLLGDKENDPYHIVDIYIPDQTVTATSVDNIKCEEFNQLPVIGVIHSHHGMGNGFSGTDHEWINQNHNISLCIAKSGIAGQVRMTTPCGALKIVEATIMVKYPDDEFDFEKWVGEETKKIKTHTYTSNYTYNSSVYNGRGWHKGQPGYWRGNTFYPENEVDENPQKPTGERKVPRHSPQPLSESQKQYSTGVAVTNNKEITSDDVPTIDEDISLAEALSMLSGEKSETIVTPVSIEDDKKDDKKDEWCVDMI